MTRNDDDDKKLWQGRGYVEFNDPDDESVPLFENPPTVSVIDSDGELMEYVYDPVTGRMTFLPLMR